MSYTSEVLNRTTGDLEEVQWMTLTEYGKTKGVGVKQVRDVLTTMGLLEKETSANPKSDHSTTRNRLTKHAIERGLGKRHDLVGKGKYPFDVLSPKGQLWIDQRWDVALDCLRSERAKSPLVDEMTEHLNAFERGRLNPDEFGMEAKVRWLIDHYPQATHGEICKVTGASKSTVFGYLNARATQLRELAEQASTWSSKRKEPSALTAVLGSFPKEHTLRISLI